MPTETRKNQGRGRCRGRAHLRRRFNRDPQFAQFYRSLEAYKNSFANKSDMMVVDPSSSEFFKIFRGGGSAVGASKK